MEQFRSALDHKGDFARGAILYRKLCLNCHRLGTEGHEVGPQLASITKKDPESLLESIIDPSAAVDSKYYNYQVLTADGRVFAGRLENETGSSVTLLATEGKRTTILRRDIEKLQSSQQSVMPEGLEQGLNPQDMADLIDFVRNTFK